MSQVTLGQDQRVGRVKSSQTIRSRTVTGLSLSKPLMALMPLAFAHPGLASVKQIQVCFCLLALNKYLSALPLCQALWVGTGHTSAQKPSPCPPGVHSLEKKVHRWTSGYSGKNPYIVCKIVCLCRLGWGLLFSRSKSCPTLCSPMNCSTPGFPVLHHLLEFAKTHVHWVDQIRSDQISRSVVSDSLRPHESQHASLSITNSQSSLRLTSIESVMPSSHLILCRPFVLLTPIPPSIRVFSNESTLCMRWPKYWSFSFSIIPSKEIPGPIFFRMDCLDLLAVQQTLKSLLQHHSSKASILQRSAFFTVQLSHPYMTTGKTIALTRQTFVGKLMSLLLNMLSRLVITFLPRSQWLLISWLQSPSAVILEPPQNKVWHCFHCFPIYFPWSDGARCYDLHFLNVEF